MTTAVAEEITPIKEADDYTIVWEPIPKSSQSFAINSRASDTLFFGSRGGGKSATQLMYFRQYVGRGYGAFWKGIIFDREYKNLSDIISQSKKFFNAFDDGAVFKSGTGECKWTWPTGEELLFRHAKKGLDYERFHGHEYSYIGYNELTKWPTSEFMDLMKTTNRSPFDPVKDTQRHEDGSYVTMDGKPLPPIPLVQFSTTNPSGPGRNWVKKKYIDSVAVGKILKKITEVFNPQTKQMEEYVHKQVAIFSSFRENIFLPPSYIAELMSIKDPNKRAAWLYGDWSVASGGCFDDLWNDKVHKVVRFKIPSNWHVDRAFDWGSSHPFSVGWFAEARGEEVTLPNGKTICPVKGSLFQIEEWYGTEEIGSNKGIKMSAPDIARGIKDIEVDLSKDRWVGSHIIGGPADNQISQTIQSDVETIEKKMADHDVRWTPSDKKKGSRINGFQLFRDRLESSVRGEGPGFYIMDNCVATLEIIPYLPRDEKNIDDVDTDAEDHIWDMIRYRVLSGINRIATNIKVKLGYF